MGSSAVRFSISCATTRSGEVASGAHAMSVAAIRLGEIRGSRRQFFMGMDIAAMLYSMRLSLR
jgi:hypothetical protein